MLPNVIEDLISALTRLPGIGRKSALRLAVNLANQDKDQLTQFANAIINFRDNLKLCTNCGNFAEGELCNICANPKRLTETVIVVENPLDIIAFEQTDFSGRYHVLGGLISPLEGIGPEKLSISELMQRLNSENIQEIIFALPTSLEGQSTVTYITNYFLKKLPGKKVKITELAKGLPTNSGLEYQDASTLRAAMNNRTNL